MCIIFYRKLIQNVSLIPIKLSLDFSNLYYFIITLFKLKYSCFTGLLQFQVYSIVIQYFCRLYSIIDYYKILNIVPSSILCIVAYQDLYANSSHQFVSSSFLHPLVIKNFIISMSFYIYIHLYYFLGYIYVLSCSICLSFSYLFYLLYS